MADPVNRDFVLKRNFLGPDGRLYHRVNAKGDVLVHTFPEEWVTKGLVPKSALAAKDAIKELAKAPEEPEPQTLKEVQAKDKKA